MLTSWLGVQLKLRKYSTRNTAAAAVENTHWVMLQAGWPGHCTKKKPRYRSQRYGVQPAHMALGSSQRCSRSHGLELVGFMGWVSVRMTLAYHPADQGRSIARLGEVLAGQRGVLGGQDDALAQ